ncbi:MAG TPA: hypothetical protein VM369_02525 [Candidatus Binatia bacterium]|nr:hypothetical protein [Candidatus Binatia bacterium]
MSPPLLAPRTSRRPLPTEPDRTVTGRFSSLALRYERVAPLGDRIATGIFMVAGLGFGGWLLTQSFGLLRVERAALYYFAALGALVVCGACAWNLFRVLRQGWRA